MITANKLRTAKRTMRTLLAGTCSPQGLSPPAWSATADATETGGRAFYTNQQFLEDIALNNSRRSRSRMQSRRSAWCLKACPTA